MLYKTLATGLALGALLTGSVAFAQTSSSTPPAPAVFPIAELGGCASKEACKLYCDESANKDACLAYAEKRGLMRKDEIEKARTFLKARIASSTPAIKRIASTTLDAILAEKGGPGGCTTREACKLYCDDTANSATCLEFAKTHKLMTAAQIELAKKLRAQVGPGGCKGEECKNYCADVSHEQVCLEFAKTNGFISKDEAEKRALRIASTTRMLPPNMGSTTLRNGSTTSPRKPELRPENKLENRPENKVGSSTRPQVFKEMQKPALPPKPATQNTSTGTNADGSNIDYSKPPYHCTPAQAEEGACDEDRFPGYKPAPGSEQGGSIFLSILRFFGL